VRLKGNPAAIVLAAGYSSRAPGFKPLLPLGGATVIESTLDSLRRGGVTDIIVVVGHRAADLLSVLGGQPVRTVINENYRDGMFSSVVAGVRALPADAGAFFLLPADMSLVSSHTVRLLARAGGKIGADIAYPVFAGRRGHPPLISVRLAPAILAWGGEGGLRPLLEGYESGAVDVAVSDEGILLDLDSAEDYQRLIRRHERRHCPTLEESEAILARLGVPASVASHGRAVADVARRLAARLNLAGRDLDEELVAAAAVLHDLAKGRPDHPRRAARLLAAMGYPGVAAVVAAHHDIAPAAAESLDEAAILYLADKLVSGDTPVSLEERFAAARKKFAADPGALAAAADRLALARRIAAKIESTLGAKGGESDGGALSPAAVVLGATESVCPECLKAIPACKTIDGDDVYLEKACPEHGVFRTIIWRGPPAYQAWTVASPPSSPPVCATAVDKGCPFDCGLCPDHRQQTCCVLLEVTSRCNLACPVCFAAAGGEGKDPDLAAVEGWFRTLLAAGGPYNIQLSGGEPTLRDDLPDIIAYGRSLGFSFFQLNTNGLRLAADSGYARRLKEAGLSCVFLQFDGLDDAVYEIIRGKPLLDVKRAAISRCAELGLGVVLVPTLVLGVNTGQIGRIIEFAAGHIPAVRGVHFQPVSYFGRYPVSPGDSGRFTLPELMRALADQSGGKMNIGDFRPTGGRNACCSFHANYLVAADGGFKLLSGAETKSCCQPRPAADSVRKVRAFVARRWSVPGGPRAATLASCPGTVTESLDEFLASVENRSLGISAMAFQDCDTFDFDRTKECPLHTLHPDGRLIPFCAYNLTDRQGRSLYRPQVAP
jgi:uncharacterized radical SAM superfamily Fe-S cluster-containing enzyme/CTP:molybdopterin cytidylyltransferase MocA